MGDAEDQQHGGARLVAAEEVVDADQRQMAHGEDEVEKDTLHGRIIGDRGSGGRVQAEGPTA